MKFLLSSRRAQRYRSTPAEHPMTEGVIWKSLLRFFFPILLGTLFQQLYNTVDAVIVGRFVGKEALAAVGGGTAVYLNLLISFFVGLTSGAGIVISQFFGAGDDGETGRSVHTALTLCFFGGLVMTALGLLATPWVLRVTKTPDDIMGLSLTYLNIFFVSMVPMFLYNMASSIMRATGDARRPLFVLIAAVCTNIALDLLFVVRFRWGVAGVAWATVASQAESMVVSLVMLARSESAVRLRARRLGVTPHILAKMLRLGLPGGIQSTFYCMSNMIIQTAINSFGTATIASWAAFGKIDAVFWTMVSTMGVAVTTFSGQNYGARKYGRLRQCMWQALLMTFAMTATCSAVFLCTGQYVFRLFATEPVVIAGGMQILRFLAPWWVSYVAIEVLSGIIRGAGDSFIPMIITLFGVCALRLTWLFAAVPRLNTITAVLACYPITWCATSALFLVYWFSGKWLKMPAETVPPRP
ncbi:MAG: MATE family efflux transporter [Treponema sp.]|nr:MATE family efflux transporter [Treponema sp.]